MKTSLAPLVHLFPVLFHCRILARVSKQRVYALTQRKYRNILAFRSMAIAQVFDVDASKDFTEEQNIPPGLTFETTYNRREYP